MRRAFTLIEMIATMVVLSIMGGVTASIIFHTADGYLQASTKSQLHHELSVALDRIVREVRRIELDDDASGTAPHIDSVTADSMAWRNGDDTAYRVGLAGDEIRLAVGDGIEHVLLTDVTAFAIRTYDEANDALAVSVAADACDPIRRVELSITLSRYGVSETLGTKVFIRSTMSGL